MEKKYIIIGVIIILLAIGGFIWYKKSKDKAVDDVVDIVEPKSGKSNSRAKEIASKKNKINEIISSLNESSKENTTDRIAIKEKVRKERALLSEAKSLGYNLKLNSDNTYTI